MRTRVQTLILVALLICADVLMIVTGWGIAFFLRAHNDTWPFEFFSIPVYYRDLVLLALPLWILAFALAHLYDREALLGGPHEYGNVVKGCLFGFAALMAVSFLIKTPDLARAWLLLGLALTTLLVGVARFGMRRFFYSLRPRGWFVERALIVGANGDARTIARQLSPCSRTGVQVVGFVDDFLPVGTVVSDGLRVLGATPNLHEITAAERIEQVILVSGAMAWESLDQLLRGITLERRDKYAIKLSPGMYEALTTGVHVSYKNRVPLLEIERAPITGVDALLKSLLDYGVGAVALVAFLPLMGAIALVLWFLGQRPVWCAQTVLGKHGKLFKTRLFQSLRPGDPKWERGNRFGVWLFATGLDKLPQFFNVLGGHMSLIGPRPVNPAQSAKYELWLPNLLSLKPGLTGARASSAENWITLEQEMRLELYYARNYSIWYDLQIMYQTLTRMWRHDRVLRKDELNQAASADVNFQSTVFTA